MEWTGYENPRRDPAAAVPHSPADAPVYLRPTLRFGPDETQTQPDDGIANRHRDLCREPDQYPGKTDSSNGIDAGRPDGGVRTPRTMARDHASAPGNHHCHQCRRLPHSSGAGGL